MILAESPAQPQPVPFAHGFCELLFHYPVRADTGWEVVGEKVVTILNDHDGALTVRVQLSRHHHPDYENRIDGSQDQTGRPGTEADRLGQDGGSTG